MSTDPQKAAEPQRDGGPRGFAIVLATIAIMLPRFPERWRRLQIPPHPARAHILRAKVRVHH